MISSNNTAGMIQWLKRVAGLPKTAHSGEADDGEESKEGKDDDGDSNGRSSKKQRTD
jgi:hypothetical protein